MFDVLGDINWLAVLVATFVYFMLGAVWFTPLFGKAYDKALGFNRAKGQKWPPIYYIGPFLNSLVVTTTTAILMHALHIEEMSDAVALGLIVGIGYLAAISFNNAITPKMADPLLYGAVTGSYHTVCAVAAAAILVSMG